MQTNVKNCYEIKFMGFIVQQLRYIIFFVFIVLRFPKPMSCQMQKRITSKTAADFSLRKCGHWSQMWVYVKGWGHVGDGGEQKKI